MTATTSKKQIKALNTGKRTLDIQHSQKLSQIQEYEEKQKTLKEQLKEVNKSLEIFNQLKQQNGNLNDEDFDKYISCVDRREDLQRQLDNIKEKIDETDYYVNTGHTLFKYYEIVEKGEGEEDGVNNINVGENSILKYFIKSNEPVADETTDDCSYNKRDDRDDRASLLDKYLSVTDDNYISPVCYETKEACKHCGSANMKMLPHDGISYCGDCSSIEFVSLEHERPSYHQANYEISYFSYKRINHLNECISQIQGKETTDIPQEVYDMILLEIKKQKITNMAELTPKKLRGILKKLRLNRYYEHLIHLVSKLTGLNIPHLDTEVEEKLRVMFKMIQPAFLKHAPSSRKNFLSYSYTLRKCVELLERDEYLDLFPVLKSRDKAFEQDKIWAKICQELNWQFIPSL
jgi:hypothetical protein